LNQVQLSDRDVVARRGPKALVDPRRAYAATAEDERDQSGTLAATAVVFLTNRECPFHCVMCDLWRHTLDDVVPPGAIAAQLRTALASLPPARQIKLYNAGSFFDPQAVPPSEDAAIAALLTGFNRVIVEAHPAFLRGTYGRRCVRFRELLGGARLEVAIGLETAHPGVLERLNKRMTLEDFAASVRFLRARDMDVRAFLLLQPPFMDPRDAVYWTCRSIDLAFDAGAGVCSVIPTRGGNGAMEAIGAPAPLLTALESVIEYGVAGGRGRVFADLWDVDRLFVCHCSPARAARLNQMNQTQQIPAPVLCDCAARH